MLLFVPIWHKMARGFHEREQEKQKCSNRKQAKKTSSSYSFGSGNLLPMSESFILLWFFQKLYFLKYVVSELFRDKK